VSVTACTEFLRTAYESAELQRQMKAMTATPEIVKFGHRLGYDFDMAELAKASSAFNRAGAGTKFHHHEYSIEDVPELRPVLEELPNLKVRPPTVDLADFDEHFRAEDLASTSRTPSEPAYQRWHQEQAKLGWRDGTGPRRDFHLINLDEHVEHPAYDAYFDAKLRTLTALEKVFGSEVRFSGSMWYPPNSYRLWHTNENQPGWRMYVIDFDGEFDDPAQTSFFRYQKPGTGELVTLGERPRIVRFFKAEQDPAKLFWHCIVNPTNRSRWSFGFVVPENWIESLR